MENYIPMEEDDMMALELPSGCALPFPKAQPASDCKLPISPEHQLKDPEVSNGIPQECFFDRRIPSVVTIFRYPNFLKDSKSEKAYVPQAVSLGPYHSSRANLSGMDDHKKRAQHRMMTRFNIKHSNRLHDRELYNSATGISKDNEAVWNNYEEKFPDKSCDLVLDGCFLLEILRTLGGDDPIGEGSNYYEPIFERRKILVTGFDILNDILKVENQIPLIVLRKLLQLEFNSVDTADKFLFDVLVKSLGPKFYPFDYNTTEWSWPQPVEQVHHLLGLLHSLIVSPPSNERAIQIDDNGKQKSGKDDRCIPTAVQLSNVGIKFQRCNGCIKKIDYPVSPPSNEWKERRCIPPAVELSNAGIKFRRCHGGIKKIYFDEKIATMYLPPINVTDHTEVLFRNLVALELCQASGGNYVNWYLSLMNNLINTDKDVAVLRKSAIINICVGNDAEVADLFNGLCKGITLPPEGVFLELENDVTAYYERKFRVLFAQFKKTYFSAWTIPVILGLLLTLVQTIYAIFQYK